MRDWLYNVITAFANDVSVRMGNRITDTAVWCNHKADDIEGARWDAINYINYLMQSPPWPFDQALLWFWGLINNSIVTPAFNGARSIFIKGSEYIVSFFDFGASMYVPERWLRDIIYNVRDRIINVIDDTSTLINNTSTWVTNLVNSTRTALQSPIDTLMSWRDDLAAWIRTSIVIPMGAIVGNAQSLANAFLQLRTDIQSVTLNPVDWIWSHIEGPLRQKVTDWLNSIWYTRI